jgi:hypothetical protein
LLPKVFLPRLQVSHVQQPQIHGIQVSLIDAMGSCQVDFQVLLDAIANFTHQLTGKLVNRLLPIYKGKIPHQPDCTEYLQEKRHDKDEAEWDFTLIV